MPAGLHNDIPTREKLQREHAYLVQLWRELDDIMLSNFTAVERVHFEHALRYLEDTVDALGLVVSTNAGKPSVRWT